MCLSDETHDNCYVVRFTSPIKLIVSGGIPFKRTDPPFVVHALLSVLYQPVCHVLNDLVLWRVRACK